MTEKEETNMRPATQLDFGIDPLDIWLTTKQVAAHPHSPIDSIDKLYKLSQRAAENGLKEKKALVNRKGCGMKWNLRNLIDWYVDY